MAVTAQGVREAAATIAGAIEETPCLPSRTLSDATGAEVFLKFENLQFTASFKERGALNKLATLSASERAAGVLAVSAGNHAQAVATREAPGIRATIVMPRFTLHEVERTRVRRRSDSVGDLPAKAAPRAESGSRSHPTTTARDLRPGTVALECLPCARSRGDRRAGGRRRPDLGIAVREGREPRHRDLGVEDGFPAMLRAARRRELRRQHDRQDRWKAGALTLPIVKALAADVLSATARHRAGDRHAARDRRSWSRVRAPPLAALLRHPERFRGARGRGALRRQYRPARSFDIISAAWRAPGVLRG
jgi:threonine dehydratase